MCLFSASHKGVPETKPQSLGSLSGSLKRAQQGCPTPCLSHNAGVEPRWGRWAQGARGGCKGAFPHGHLWSPSRPFSLIASVCATPNSNLVHCLTPLSSSETPFPSQPCSSEIRHGEPVLTEEGSQDACPRNRLMGTGPLPSSLATKATSARAARCTQCSLGIK